MHRESRDCTQVDATVETELSRRYDVSGYPTIKWFRKGIAYDYEGERTADGKGNDIAGICLS